MLQRSNDAIVQVQEGIVVDANPAWLELFGVKDSLVGQPVMDLFDEATQPALKGALAACLQGRWNDLALKATALLPDGKTMAVEIVLALGQHDGEPSVRLIVPAKARDEQNLVEELSHAVHSDHTTGFLHRRELMDALHERLAGPEPRRHALSGVGEARQVRDGGARRRRLGQRGCADGNRDAPEGDAAIPTRSSAASAG